MLYQLTKKCISNTHLIVALALCALSIPSFSDDTTTYVRLNSNPFASPFYIFSTEPNGESIELSLEKGYSHTFIRTDSNHAFNIGDDWKVANSDIQYSSNGSGAVEGAASIVNGEQLTITIPSDFSGNSLMYYCYAHGSMKLSFNLIDNTDSDQLYGWDFDQNGDVDALTDGLLLLRYAFGIRGSALTAGAISADSSSSSQQVEDYLNAASPILDIDGNGSMDALTDGLLLLRYLFGVRGESLINGAVSSSATRAYIDQVEEYIGSLMPDLLLARASGLLVQMKSTQEFSSNFTQSYDRAFGEVMDMIAVDAMPEMAMDASTSESGGDSFTTTYTLEKNIDEHDFVKYDGEHLFIAPSYSLYDDCCFIFDEPIVLFDDAIEVGEELAVADEPLQPIIPELRSIKIMATNPSQASVSEAGNIIVDDNRTIEGLYTNGDQLASISTSGWWGMYGTAFMDPSVWRGQTTGLSVYDISDVTNPELDWKFEVEGGFVTSRKKGDLVYLVARHTPEIHHYIDFPTFNQQATNQEILNDVSSSVLLPKAFINN